MWSRTHRALVVLVSTLALAGCSPVGDEQQPSPSQPPLATESDVVLTVAEALLADKPMAEVRGYILAGREGVTRLCTGMAGSYPPQCGLPALTVKGLDTRDIPNSESDQGVTWSGETTLRGALSGGILTVG